MDKTKETLEKDLAIVRAKLFQVLASIEGLSLLVGSMQNHTIEAIAKAGKGGE